MKTSDVCTPSSSSSSRLTVELDKAVQRVVQKVLDEHLFPDGFDASQVAAQLKAEFLRGVVGRRTLEDAVARSVDASAGKLKWLKIPLKKSWIRIGIKIKWFVASETSHP